MRTVPPVSPGEMLNEEFLKPLGLTKYRLAKDIGVPAQRIGDIVAGKGGHHGRHRLAAVPLLRAQRRLVAARPGQLRHSDRPSVDGRSAFTHLALWIAGGLRPATAQ